MYIYTYIPTYMYVYTYIYIYMYMYMYKYKYKYKYKYIHRYTRIGVFMCIYDIYACICKRMLYPIGMLVLPYVLQLS